MELGKNYISVTIISPNFFQIGFAEIISYRGEKNNARNQQNFLLSKDNWVKVQSERKLIQQSVSLSCGIHSKSPGSITSYVI